MLRLPDSMTVAQLREIERENPDIPQYIHRVTARSYADFLATLYVVIDAIIISLQNDRNVLQGHSENALNADIVRQLVRAGYTAHFDKNKSGHADITVEYAQYQWIGEGKKVKSVNNSHLKDGYDQLVERYVPGTPDADHDGLLIYSFGKDTKRVVKVWSEHLVECNGTTPGYATDIVFPPEKNGFEFNCRHAHVGGGELKIRNIGLQLYWNPPK